MGGNTRDNYRRLMIPHLVRIRVGKVDWNVITEIVRNEMLEGRRESHTWCQGDSMVEIPELEESWYSISIRNIINKKERLALLINPAIEEWVYVRPLLVPSCSITPDPTHGEIRMVGTLRYTWDWHVRIIFWVFLKNGDAPDPKSGKVEGIVLAISSSFSIGQAVGVRDTNGWWNMIGKSLWRIDKSEWAISGYKKV